MDHKDWRKVAKAIQKETDSDKLSRLVSELCQALDHQDHQLDAKEETTINEPGSDGKECTTKEVKEVQRLEEWQQRHRRDRQ